MKERFFPFRKRKIQLDDVEMCLNNDTHSHFSMRFYSADLANSMCNNFWYYYYYHEIIDIENSKSTTFSDSNEYIYGGKTKNFEMEFKSYN